MGQWGNEKMTIGRIGMALAGVAALLGMALTVRSATVVRPEPAKATINYDWTLKDMDGRDVTLKTYAHRPMVINLWATWCGPCRLEMPQLIDLYTKYRERGLMIVGISVDDPLAKIKPFAREYNVPYLLLAGLDHPEVLEPLGYKDGMPGVPMSIFVKADGTIMETVVGIDTTAAMERRILALFQ
jgi:thiol-disulfide isomerase/thioredoxin